MVSKLSLFYSSITLIYVSPTLSDLTYDKFSTVAIAEFSVLIV